jgi:2-phosphoglycerate kinase
VIYLIGGPARCGKSTLAARVRGNIDGQVLSGDAFVNALKENLDSSWVPDIYEHDVASIKEMPNDDAAIDRLRRRDEKMWQFYHSYIRTAVEDAPGDDLLLEGNLWPDFLELFSLPHKAVFLIDTSPQQVERLKTIQDSGDNNNWMRNFTDERLGAWANFNAIRSERYAKLCKKHGYRYFDIASDGVGKVLDDAYEYLFEKVV